MAKLISDYFCVATSGPTVDGREIRAQWLKDMAETYDSNVYEAMLWYEHYRWGGNYGSLYAVKVEKGDDGLYRLYNRLIPSPQMQELNRSGQKLHSSIEVLTEFRNKKKAYQYGLGITDSPASVGTDRLSFSAGNEQPSDDELEMLSGVCQAFNASKVVEYKKRVPGVNPDHLEIFVSQPLPDLEFSKEKTIFDFNFGGLFGRNHTDTEEGNDMNKEDTAALIDEKLEAFGTQFTDQLMTKLTEKFSTNSDQGDNKPDTSSTDKSSDKEEKPEGNADEQQFTALEEKIDGLAGKFDQLMDKLGKISDGKIDHSEADGDGEQQEKITF